MFCFCFVNTDDHKTKGSGLAPWPARMTSPPPRLADFGYSTHMFEKDTVRQPQPILIDSYISKKLKHVVFVCLCLQELWKQQVDSYWNLMSSKVKANTVRNIMDMKAHMGSFAAALKDKDVWVMNVVSPYGPNTLKLIYDRGLIGTNHNWYKPHNR